MYYLVKTLLLALFSGANLFLILFLSDFWLDVYGVIFSSSLVVMTLCSIFISEFETAYLLQAIKNLQIMNKQIAKTYKINYKPGSLEKMSNRAKNRERDEDEKFI